MKITAPALVLFELLMAPSVQAKNLELLNVSYDPTRELYAELNMAFAKHWKAQTGDQVRINQSHGGSGKQARSVIDGLDADVVTLALAYDVDAIQKSTGKLPKDWQRRLPFNSCPYTSTIVLVVRKGNPKGIKGWDDLVRADVKVITPNPKTSGGARWNYLAVWGFAWTKFGKDEAKTRDFVARVYKNVPVLDSGARGSITTFAQRRLGDVLIAWENEALFLVNRLGKDKFEAVVPSLSILAEPPVAMVEKNAARHGTTAVVRAYLEFLYGHEGQEIIARHFYRPRDTGVAARHAPPFPKLKLLTIDADLGGWITSQKSHFADGGTFDQIFPLGR